jgi:hypothetical protein
MPRHRVFIERCRRICGEGHRGQFIVADDIAIFTFRREFRDYSSRWFDGNAFRRYFETTPVLRKFVGAN